MYDDNNKTFAAYSALFNYTKDSVFIRNNLANRVSVLFNDSAESNLKIKDENRLRKVLFSEIQEKYNQRLIHYKLLQPKLKDEDVNTLEIEKFSLTSSTDGNISGYYKIFPRAFYCKKCGDFKAFTANSDEWKKFDPSKCSNPNCDGEYRQFPFVGFCEKCGKITDMFQLCRTHKDQYLKLIQYDPTSPIEWKLRCTKCGEEWDFLPFCNHTNFKKNALLKAPPEKYRPVNIQQGSVSKSVVLTTVDIPNYSIGNLPYLDYISYGLYMDKFEKLKDSENFRFSNVKSILEQINIEEYDSSQADNLFSMYREDLVEDLDYFLTELKNIVTLEKKSSIREINDYLILKGFYSDDLLSTNINQNNSLNVTKFEDLSTYNDKKDEYENMKDDLGIEDIFYISDIHLISSSIGSIKGINKFYESSFIPHFEPYRNYKNNNLKVYSYPFETEALLIDLDKIKIVKWLIDNKFINNDYPTSKNEAKEILINLEEENPIAYTEVKKLVHTLSHVLINRSSLYTGLQTDSCSELLFPKSGAFVIYSTSNIKIGGFLYVFENNLFEWFKDVKLDVNDCIFDPTCIDETGACFSCVYLPEFVCSDFNNDLDRDVFLGSTNRYKKGYWE